MIRIYSFDQVPPEEIFARAEEAVDVSGVVREIIDQVRRRGDAALLEYAEKFDAVERPQAKGRLLVFP